MNTHPQDLTEIFGQPIYTYTRAQAVADGLQVEVTKTAAEAGIRFPMFITRAVYDAYVTVPAGVTGQDEAGRLWDLVWMTRFAIIRSRPGVDRLPGRPLCPQRRCPLPAGQAGRRVRPLDFDDPAARHYPDAAGRGLNPPPQTTPHRPPTDTPHDRSPTLAKQGKPAPKRFAQIFAQKTASLGKSLPPRASL